MYQYVGNVPNVGLDPHGTLNLCKLSDIIDANPNVDASIQCACGIMAILDIIPPGLPVVGAIGLAGGIMDCICNMFHSYRACCQCAKGGAFNVMGCLLQIGAALLDCALEFVSQVQTVIQMLSQIVLEATLTMTEIMAQIQANPNIQVPPGIFAC